jgi:hypothetical protein
MSEANGKIAAPGRHGVQRPSLTFPWSEFNMTAPSVGGFVNVTNKATMEFDLHLQRVPLPAVERASQAVHRSRSDCRSGTDSRAIAAHGEASAPSWKPVAPRCPLVLAIGASGRVRATSPALRSAIRSCSRGSLASGDP